MRYLSRPNEVEAEQWCAKKREKGCSICGFKILYVGVDDTLKEIRVCVSNGDFTHSFVVNSPEDWVVCDHSFRFKVLNNNDFCENYTMKMYDE